MATVTVPSPRIHVDAHIAIPSHVADEIIAEAAQYQAAVHAEIDRLTARLPAGIEDESAGQGMEAG